jgi:hypothetical protein
MREPATELSELLRNSLKSCGRSGAMARADADEVGCSTRSLYLEDRMWRAHRSSFRCIQGSGSSRDSPTSIHF